MNKNSVWMAGVATAALLLSGSMASAADGGSGASSSAVAQANERIDDLNTRIESLEAELQAAETRAATDHDTVGATAASVGQAWWNNTQISGRMYFDVSHVEQNVNGVRSGVNNGTGFDIKRFYIGIDHKFDDTFSANVTTDFLYDSTTGANQIYIKKAYLQAKVSDALVFRLGSTDLPWIPFVEDTYGFRYIENTLIDHLKYGTSADWGAHVSGKLYDGILNYAVSVVNGAGYKKANLFRTNGPDVEGRVNVNYDHFIVGVGGYWGKLGVQFGSALHHEATRFDAIAAYEPDNFKIGVEYFEAQNFLSVSSATQTDHAAGVSGFGSWTFMPQWTVFGRYDYAKRKTNALVPVSVPDNYYNVGIEWNPVKIVDLSLVYKHEDASHGTFSTSNGTIGGSIDGDYDEIGLFGQLRW